MLGLIPEPLRGGRLEVLCVGAHCDDIEIGCGGTILSLQQRYPRCRIHHLVLTSDTTRRREAGMAARAFVRPAARGTVRICELQDGFLPAHFDDVKTEFEAVKRTIAPHLVLTHHGADRHQDHRLVSEVTWQTFRDHMIWEYEIPKYDGDLATPNLYVPIASGIASRKIAMLVRHFRSQRDRTWFTGDNFGAAMRMRGLECRAPDGFAEAFHCRKLVLGPTGTSRTSRGRCQ